MLFQTLWGGTEQLTLWKWTEFVGRKWDVYCIFFFIHLLSCLPDRLPGSVFQQQTGRECISTNMLSLSMCKESKDKLCYSDVQAFLCMFYANSCILCRAQILLFTSCIPIDQVVFCYLLLIVTTLTIVKKKVQHFFIFYYFPRLN